MTLPQPTVRQGANAWMMGHICNDMRAHQSMGLFFMEFVQGEKTMSLTVGEDYLHATQNPLQGKILYDSGELYYEGGCVKLSTSQVCPCGIGIQYYKDGTIKKQGLFQRRGLVCGRMYYPSGKLRFEGYCVEPNGYGPAYPTYGTFYGEDGALLYQGAFSCKFGGVGYPMVIVPENFGSLS
jgi:hypothetical protein